MVFFATGSASFDFYGANRLGDNLYANSIVALDANTGKRIWHFQGLKHDLWDRDFPASPTLVTVTRNARPVDAVAQITKTGHVWLLERTTGRELFPSEWKRMPPAMLDGEVTADSQRFPVLPPPFARQQLTEEGLTNRTPEAAARSRSSAKPHAHPFTPPNLTGIIIFPGVDGGGEYGGGPSTARRALLRELNEMAWLSRSCRARTSRSSAPTAPSAMGREYAQRADAEGVGGGSRASRSQTIRQARGAGLCHGARQRRDQ
jgi:quinoprotein glucose dehydrogenase